MAAKETTLKEVGEMLAYVVEHMATKDDLKGFATKEDLKAFREETTENFRTLRAELADIRRELDDLRLRVVNVTGYRKEIDYALERIAAIEKHLGIEKGIAA